jgi:hypothetical protein
MFYEQCKIKQGAGMVRGQSKEGEEAAGLCHLSFNLNHTCYPVQIHRLKNFEA